MHAAEGDGGGDADRAGQRSAPLRHIGSGFLDLAHDARGTLEEDRAILRQSELAGRSMQQHAAQRLFQFRQPFADDGFGQPQPPGRLADRARLNHGDESRNTFDPDHCSAFPNSSSRSED